jgi:hypothetical protein
MRSAALLDVDLVNAEALGEPVGTDEGRVAFAQRDDILFFQFPAALLPSSTTPRCLVQAGNQKSAATQNRIFA